MLKSKKHVLWEALVVTVAVFLIGLFLGMIVESKNQSQILDYSTESEVMLLDAFNFVNQIDSSKASCEVLKKENIEFANRIYKEAIILEDYENAGILTDNMRPLHKKYDLLRSILWTTNTKVLDKCGDEYNLLVYLYNYESESEAQKAKQGVWSKILYELKLEKGDDMVLLPIAGDQNVSSINLLKEKYNIKSLPALVINNREVLYEIDTIDSLRNQLEQNELQIIKENANDSVISLN